MSGRLSLLIAALLIVPGFLIISEPAEAQTTTRQLTQRYYLHGLSPTEGWINDLPVDPDSATGITDTRDNTDITMTFVQQFDFPEGWEFNPVYEFIFDFDITGSYSQFYSITLLYGGQTVGTTASSGTAQFSHSLSTIDSNSSLEIEIALRTSTGYWELPVIGNRNWIDVPLLLDDDDLDWVANSADDCPTISGTSSIDQMGCPDQDGDGYSDIGDDCPLAPGSSFRDRVGCADTDLDGWSDMELCPDVYGTPTDGCPPGYIPPAGGNITIVNNYNNYTNVTNEYVDNEQSTNGSAGDEDLENETIDGEPEPGEVDETPFIGLFGIFVAVFLAVIFIASRRNRDSG